jgi:hypothetical protein
VVDESLKPLAGATVCAGGVCANTGVSGFYSFNLGSDMWGHDFTVTAEQSGHTATPVTLEDVYCDDQVVNFQVIMCDEIWVMGTVWDNETGLPIAGAKVTATNEEGVADGDTDANGVYTVGPLPYDPNNTTWVIATAEGYNPMADSLWINCGDTARIDFQLHTSPMSRILLYHGNKGDNEGYTDARDMFLYMGYLVDYTNVWPTDPDLEEYKVIFLLGPGNTNSPQDHAGTFFTPGQLVQLDLFLRHGGRLVIMAEAGQAVTTENTLVGALNDLDFEFRDAAAGIGRTVANALADQITPDQLTLGVATLNFGTATDLMLYPGAAPGLLAELPGTHATDPGADMLAADTLPGITRLPGYHAVTNRHPGFAGDVVLIGDLDWMDDGSSMCVVQYDPMDPTKVVYFWPDWPADNENLLLNIITF